MASVGISGQGQQTGSAERPLSDFAIVMAVRNGADTIAAALDSIAAALAQGAELWVYDAESVDATRDIVLARVPDAHYTCRMDGGLYFAWNKAIGEVTQPFLYFLNCDDKLVSEEVLIEMVGRLQNANNLTAVHGKTRMRRADGAIRFAGEAVHTDAFYGDMPIVTPASVYRVSHLRSIGGFNTAYSISADYDLVQRLLQRHSHSAFSFIDEPVTDFALEGMSNAQRQAAFAQIRTIIRHNLGYGGLIRHSIWFGFTEFKRLLLSLYFAMAGKK